MSNKYHIAQSGKNAGKYVPCVAKTSCRIGGEHLTKDQAEIKNLMSAGDKLLSESSMNKNNKDNILLPVDLLKTILHNRNIVKNSTEDYHQKANWETFQLAMRLLNPQSYGAHFEKRIRIAYGWKKVPAKERIGDASYELNGNTVNSEIKVSLTTETDKNVNVVQIRDSHKMDYYDIFIIHENNNVERFRLSKEQMKEELISTGARLAHGTRGNDDGKYDNAEFRIDFKATSNDVIYNRWKQKYLLVDGEKQLITYTP